MPVRITTFNVEHGSCHAILEDSGRTVVVDLGSSDSFCPLDWLKSQGRTTIDLLVITHPHADHIRTIAKLSGFTVTTLLRPRNVPVDLLSDLDPVLKRAWTTLDSAYSGPLAPGSDFWNPAVPSHSCFTLRFLGGVSESTNLNNYSVVTVLDYFGLRMVFPGDLEQAGWAPILSDQSFKSAAAGAQLLVAAHHGRKAGWCPELFSIVSPHLTIISDGSEQETSYSSQYSEKSSGAKVQAMNTGETKERRVVSTRDNGFIDIYAWLQEQVNAVTGLKDYLPVYTVKIATH